MVRKVWRRSFPHLESVSRSSFASDTCPDSLSAGKAQSCARVGYTFLPKPIARMRHRIISRGSGISKARFLPPLGLEMLVLRGVHSDLLSFDVAAVMRKRNRMVNL